MQLRLFIHQASKRAETIALLNSGATENFINAEYAKQIRLPVKRLARPRPVFSVDGSKNKNGQITHYVDLQVQTGPSRNNLRFFLTSLGEQKVILGYPWFAAAQPKIDWARGWIDGSQLPLVARTQAATQMKIGVCRITPY